MMSHKIQIILYLVIIAVVAGISTILIRWGRSAQRNSSIADHFNTGWATNPLWDDGKAEVTTYNAERIVYGKIRKFSYKYILVKETFNEAYNVKTDDYSRNDLFDVMKVNKFTRIPTENYPYQYLSSLFLRRDDPVRLFKFTNSSQEWCGNTFKHFSRNQTGIAYEYDSYWDGEGRGSSVLPAGILFEDQLSYTFRTMNFAEGLTFECDVVESQVTNRATPPVIYHAIVSVFTCNQDPYGLCWEVHIDLDDEKTNIYWIDAEYPNMLLRMNAWDGRKLVLNHAERETYWQE